ncbi:MAG: hypothetical protein ACN6PV_22605 [Achromobacter sp.]|uniref:hypothetical protein n=1 Tax=Achromobacter sp. TaxID=134375 RepID=UPI003CFEB23D
MSVPPPWAARVRTTAAAPSLRSPEKPEAQPISRGDWGMRGPVGLAVSGHYRHARIIRKIERSD